MKLIINKLLYLLLVSISWSCTSDSNTEKYQSKRDNVLNVRAKIKKIEMEDVLIGQHPLLYLMGDYLIISDAKSLDELIYLFDKNEFSYITGFGHLGQGPGEITNLGHIGVDEVNRMLYISDHGKQTIFSYKLDSVLANPNYMPKVKIKMNREQFPSKYQYINDTLSIGLIINPIGVSDFKPTVAKWNMNTGEIQRMKYEHPDIEKKRITFAASMENGIYVECYSKYDLMTICSLTGDLKYNIYGPAWSSRGDALYHYSKVLFCNDKIVAAYSGETYGRNDFATKFFIFDVSGNYIQTLETGYKILDFCYDKENNRIIMGLDDEMQFAYLDLNKVIQ